MFINKIISALSFSSEVWMSLFLGAVVTVVIAYVIYKIQKKETIIHKQDHDAKLERIEQLHLQDSEKIRVLYELILKSQSGSIGEIEATKLEQKIEDAAELITEDDSDHAQALKAIAEKDSDKADELLDKLSKYEHDLEELYNLHAMNEHRLGNYPDEIPWREKLVALKPDNYEYKLRLFNAFIATGRIDEAEHLANETIATLRAAAEPDKLNILRWMYTLGSVNLQKAKPQLAEEYYKQALEFGISFLGTEHTELYNIYNDLGCLCLNKGDNIKAEEYFRFALKMHIVEDADDAVNRGYMICNIATALKGQGRIEEAKELYHEGLQELIKTVGDDHPALNFYYGHLGYINYFQNKLPEAKE